MDKPRRKPLEWIGSSHRDLDAFPPAVGQDMGHALAAAQEGEKHPAAKPLKGFRGASVLEIVANFAGDTYRTVYTVQFAGVVYVLHAFKKKSARGIATPKREVDLVHARFKEAERIHQGRDRWRVRERPLAPYGPEEPMDAEHFPIGHTPSSGNVFADLNLPNADVLLAQSGLMIDITRTIRQRRLSRTEAASIMGITAQEVKDIAWGDFDNFSVERLTGLLATLVEAGEAKGTGRSRGRSAVRRAQH